MKKEGIMKNEGLKVSQTNPSMVYLARKRTDYSAKDSLPQCG